MNVKTRAINFKIRRMLDAAGHLAAAAASLHEAGQFDLADGLLEKRAQVVQDAKHKATSVTPGFWDAWRETFEDLEA